MDINEILNLLGGAVGGGIITQIVNWRINRKKGFAEAKNAEAEASHTEAEAHNQEIENMRKAMEDFYTPLVKKQNERIAELEAEVKQLREEKRAAEETHAKQLALLQSQIVEINRALGIKAKSVIRENNTTYHERSSKSK